MTVGCCSSDTLSLKKLPMMLIHKAHYVPILNPRLEKIFQYKREEGIQLVPQKIIMPSSLYRMML